MADLLDPQGAGNQDDAGAAVQEPQGGTSEPAWLAGVDESLRKSLGKFKEPIEVGRAYVELEKKLGSSVQIPKADASPEEWGKFFSRVGRPDSPDKYELPEEGLTDELRARIRKEAYESGATPKMVQALIGTILEDAKARMQAEEKASEERFTASVNELKKEFGDQYEANVQLANRALKGLFPSAAQAFIDRGFGNDPALIRDLVALGRRLGEDKLVVGNPAAPKETHPYDWMRKEFVQQ